MVSLNNSNIESLHDLVMVWLLVIMLTVIIISGGVFMKNQITFINLDSLILEVTWTILPIFILISIAFPSLSLLCSQDTNLIFPSCSLKIVGNQWNWQSEQEESLDHVLDSMKLDDSSSYESPFSIPYGYPSRFLVTSSDVLHSLGIPSLGVKLDATPGRLNAVILEPMFLGLLTGSCYELCGSGHSAMPIYAFVN